jgi:DNA end-binding protein Ku
MHAIWKGTISFGLVSIPVALYPAVRKDELKFRMLRKSDLSPINYKRVAENDGAEVPYQEVAKGYEYEKGEFVIVEEEDFQRAKAEGVQTVQIVDFVSLNEIDPVYFDKPYYLQPEKGGAKAYALLRDSMLESGTVGIAKVVIKSRQHLAALKPKGNLLVLELMHFAEDLVDQNNFQAPQEKMLGKKEKDMAKALIDAMKNPWDPQKYRDDYKSALLEVIEQKVKAGGQGGKKGATRQRMPSNVVDVVEMLERSLRDAAQTSRGKAKRKKIAAA